MMSYRYLIGYVAESRQGQHIVSATIDRIEPILTSKDIEKLQSYLQKECGAEKVTLLSFSKLKSVD